MGDRSDSTSTSDTNPPGPSSARASHSSSQAFQAQSTVTSINFVNVGQVIHVTGENNIVQIPNTKIAMYQQAVGMNPTIGLAAPSSSVPPQTDTPPPYSSATEHGTTCATATMGVFVGQGGTMASSCQEQGIGTSQPYTTYAEVLTWKKAWRNSSHATMYLDVRWTFGGVAHSLEKRKFRKPPHSCSQRMCHSSTCQGPPEAIELVELTYKLMGVLGENWTILGSCLSVPDHELVATEVEEKTLYRRVNRLLKFWVNLSEDNDRKHLASVLSQVGQYNLGRYASEVLQKVPTMHSI